MIPKTKAPMWSRAQRRHPKRVLSAMAPAGSAPSELLQRLLILNGYWPENDVHKLHHDPAEQAPAPVQVQAAERKGFVSRVLSKAKSFFGLKRGG